MSSCFHWIAPLVLILGLTGGAWADACFPVLRPHPREFWREANSELQYDFTIVRDPDAKQAELRIPRKWAVAEGGSGVRTQYAMTGLAISAAFVGGGVWFLRAHERIPKKTVLGIGAAVVLLMAGITLSNIALATPPRRPPPLTKWTAFEGVDVIVNIVEQGEEVQLILPPSLAENLDINWNWIR